MKPLLATLTVLIATTAGAAGIDMDDPYRALGRENDVRVDAQLLSEVIRLGSPIAVTYQIENMSRTAVAVAAKICTASYDADTRTIVVSVGSEIPLDGNLPLMQMIASGEKKVFTTSTTLGGSASAIQISRTAPRFLQIKVSVLRNLEPFHELIAQQQAAPVPSRIALTDAQFDQWFDANATIYLNSLPVRYEGRAGGKFDASRASYGSR